MQGKKPYQRAKTDKKITETIPQTFVMMLVDEKKF
jgi:hypothetical protein